MKPQHIQPTIVAGIDRTAADDDVLCAAIAQTRAAAARLVIVHALDRAEGSAMLTSDREDYRRHIAADIGRQLGKLFTNEQSRVPTEVLVDWGGAATMLLAAAQSAAMVVIGTHGPDHHTPMLLGLVAQDIAVHADCGVLLVPVSQSRQAQKVS